MHFNSVLYSIVHCAYWGTICYNAYYDNGSAAELSLGMNPCVFPFTSVS